MKDKLNKTYALLGEARDLVFQMHEAMPDEGNSSEARSNNAMMIMIAKATTIRDECGLERSKHHAGRITHDYADQAIDAAEQALRHLTSDNGNITRGLDHLLDAYYFAVLTGVEL